MSSPSWLDHVQPANSGRQQPCVWAPGLVRSNGEREDSRQLPQGPSGKRPACCRSDLPRPAPPRPAPPRPARCLTARWCRLLKGSAYKKSKVPEQPLVYW